MQKLLTAAGSAVVVAAIFLAAFIWIIYTPSVTLPAAILSIAKPLGDLLAALGLAAMLGGQISLIISAFRQSAAWGVLSLFGPGLLVYIAYCWEDAKEPFFFTIGGLALVIVGAAIG